LSSSAPQPIQAASADALNPWPARTMALAVALVVSLVLGLLIWGMGRREAGSVGTAPTLLRSAPAFSLPLFEGGTFELAAARGRPVLINFWASWCVPCQDEAIAIQRASREYGGRVSVLGVNVQDSDTNARAFLRRYGVTYPNGRDAKGEIAVDYGMSGVPESYFVGSDGSLARKWQGPLDEARLREYLDELLR
jgi:cytochrome c biogenesis protein CcmG/thiol:disulfide interchange protein DsbE